MEMAGDAVSVRPEPPLHAFAAFDGVTGCSRLRATYCPVARRVVPLTDNNDEDTNPSGSATGVDRGNMCVAQADPARPPHQHVSDLPRGGSVELSRRSFVEGWTRTHSPAATSDYHLADLGVNLRAANMSSFDVGGGAHLERGGDRRRSVDLGVRPHTGGAKTTSGHAFGPR